MLLAHVAAEDRFAAIFKLNTVCKLAGRLPFRWALASAILFACSIPPMLYEALLKNRLPPHTVRWDLMLVFLITIVPARLLTGWVYHRSVHQEPREHSWSWPHMAVGQWHAVVRRRWLLRLLSLPGTNWWGTGTTCGLAVPCISSSASILMENEPRVKSRFPQENLPSF